MGDLLLQVVYHAQMAAEQGVFAFQDVARAINDKMIARHPHVFASAEVRTAAAQTDAWEQQKAAERAAKAAAQGRPASVLDDVPLALPALMRAGKLGKRAAGVGFDWPDTEGVLAKLREEMLEIEEALADGSPDAVAEEIGDLLFAAAQLARKAGCDAEEALRLANLKFTGRFKAMEAAATVENSSLSHEGMDRLQQRWIAAKNDTSGTIS